MRLIKATVLLAITLAVTSCKKDPFATKGSGEVKRNNLTVHVSDTCTSPVILWEKATINTSAANVASASSATIDRNNNLYVAGIFRGTVDIDPGPGIFNLTGKGAYVQKLDVNGKFIGARQVPLDYEDYNIPLLYYEKGFTDVDVDAGGNVILTTFAKGLVNIYKAGSSGNQIFQLTLRSAGESPVQTAVDSKGDLIIIGSYGGPDKERFDIDPGTGVYNTPASGSGIYVLKLNSGGKFQYARFYTDLTRIWDLKIDKADNLYAVGLAYENNKGIYHSFIKADRKGNILLNKFSPSDNLYTPVSVDNSGNIFMGIESVPKKYNAQGNLLWATNFTYDDVALWIHAFSGDNKGNMYVATGTYWDNDESVFIKYNDKGQELWRGAIPGVTDALRDPMFIVPDSQDNIILVISGSPPGGGGATRIIKYQACR
ncbi:hypothetical protein DJ568_07620 [Mucilaginibacter hurinus]|uniref:Bulb-type lectin domain-containing protein n=1 Tax=Mucilaginibacter hurinus TaxID=2201324 RepID=A0A367GQL9_9SPHI|nr:hypothetical protein [Mucilaginibacter hurinus]RCH55742.1 hypothetical protein DJ568_07620 [Mucilaginibacter hurinus]